jgi:hypothetical protein
VIVYGARAEGTWGIGRKRRHQRQAGRHGDAGDAVVQGMAIAEQRCRLRSRDNHNQVPGLDARRVDIELPTVELGTNGSNLRAQPDIEAVCHGARQARHAGHPDKARRIRTIIPADAGSAKIVQVSGKTRVTRRQILGTMVEADLAFGQFGSPRRHATADAAPLVEHHRPMACADEPPGTGEARHAGADDGDVVLHRCSSLGLRLNSRR